MDLAAILVKGAIPFEGTMWNLMKTGKAVSEKKDV